MGDDQPGRTPATAARWPPGGRVTAAWCTSLAATLEAATCAPAKRLPRYLPASVLAALADAAEGALRRDATLVELQPRGCPVTLVGDLHGQLHDLLRLLSLAGPPRRGRAHAGEVSGAAVCERAARPPAPAPTYPHPLPGPQRALPVRV